MIKKNRLTAALLIVTGLSLTVSCKQEKNITVDPLTMLSYIKVGDSQSMENLAKNYSTVINKNRKTGVKTPGLFSDYAVALAKQGKNAEANNWFNREMADFPSSRKYVIKLKQELIPEYVNDNTIRNDEADATTEESTLSPAARAEAEEKAASVMQPAEAGIDPVIETDESTTNKWESKTEEDETGPETGNDDDSRVEEEELKLNPSIEQ